MTKTGDLTGKTLGDYVLRQKFASGGMAEIYLGEDESLGRRAAIKILTPDLAGTDDTLRERFEREARAVGQLDHPNIVTIYQFRRQEDLYFIAMQFIEGRDLADEIKVYRQRGELLPIEKALDILKQVASALDYAHARGIIHRDVKPSNVLLSKGDDRAFLTDFGLVLWESGQAIDTTYGTAFGTPRYISPEQATDSMSVKPQSDIYSLGVILYEILTGQQLYTGNTPMEVALAHITEMPTPPRAHNPNIPREAEREILRALDKDPLRRHASAKDFINAIASAYQIDVASYPTKPDTSDDKGVNTQHFAPEELEEEIRKAQVLENAWETNSTIGDITPTVNPEDNPGSRNQLIIAGVIIIALIVGAFLLGSGMFDGGDTPTAIPPSPSLEPIAAVNTDVPTVTDESTATDEPSPTPTNTALDNPTDIPTDVPQDNTAIPVVIAPTDTPTAPPTFTPTITPSPTNTPTPTPQPLPDSIQLEIRYNTQFFAVLNRHLFALADLEGMRFSSTDRDFSIDERLAPDSCLFIKLQTASNDDIPNEWASCREQVETATLDRPLWWFVDNADASDATFEVLSDDDALVTCEAVGRAVGTLNNTCTVEWSALEDTR